MAFLSRLLQRKALEKFRAISKFCWLPSVCLSMQRNKYHESPCMSASTEPPHDKINKMNCAPNKDSDLPGYPPSLIRVFPVCMKTHWALNYLLSAQWRLWSDWADVQADLSLRWAHIILLVLLCGSSTNVQLVRASVAFWTFFFIIYNFQNDTAFTNYSAEWPKSSF